MRFLFVCGGTAGHINPALALAHEITRVSPDAKFLFVGAGRPLEKKLIPQEGYKLVNIEIRGFDRRLSPKTIFNNIKTLQMLSRSDAESGRIIAGFMPDIVIGTGGYVCYPVLSKAARMGIPTVIHESNAVPGLTTRMLAGKVNKVLVAFNGTQDQYRNPEKVIFTGTPVRGDFFRQKKNDARLNLGIDGRPLVVSFWGSLGAEHMNEMMVDFIQLNIENRLFNHIHATGGNEAVKETLKKRLADKSSGAPIPRWVDIRPYIGNMPPVMTASDLVMCRAGASTIAELTLLGKPAVIIPSPNVTNNHQLKNALQLQKGGGAVVLDEKDCTGETLFHTVRELVSDKERLRRMGEAMKNAGVPDSAKKIVEIIFSMC